MGEFSTAGFGSRTMHTPSYEGASTAYRLELKGLKAGDQDTLAARELQKLWSRSHHLCRNEAIATTAKHRLVTNWIGSGIKVRWMNENHTPAPRVQKHWEEWIKDCNLDRRGNFYNFEHSLASALMESGEAIGRMYVSKRKTAKVPLALQILEAEHLDPLYTGMGNTNTRNGITFSEEGYPVTYHLWKQHPGALLKLAGQQERLAISADDILHVFERQRPGQWRGIPWITPVILNIYGLSETIDATIQRQKAAQAMSWIIENSSPDAAFAPGTVRSTIGTGKRSQIIQGVAGGVHYLEGKESVKFASIQDIGPNLQVLLSSELGKIAAALGLTYDQLTGDLSQVNFSSIRAGLNEFRIRTEIVQRFTIINLGLEPITSRWLEMLPFYVPKLSAQGIYPKFSLPRRYGVDELKDAQADLLEVQAGFNTMENALEERDRTFQEVLAEREKISKTGYVFTSIPLVAQGTLNTQPTKVADQNNAGISDGTTSNPNSTAGANNDTSGD